MYITNKKKEIIIKILCLIASFGLWLYITNVENPIRDYKLSKVPVKILNADTLSDHKLVISPNQNFYVTLDLEGPANEVYKITTDEFKVTANLTGYALKKGENQVPVQIVNYPSNINVKNNNFLRVTIKLDDYIEKSFQIKNDLSLATKQGYHVSSPQINPQSATVSGASEYVNKVKQVVVDGEVKDMKDNLNVNLPLKAIDENGKKVEYVTVSPSNANFSVQLTKGKLVGINVQTKGSVGNRLTLNSITSNINKVELLGDSDELNKINSINTEPIDLSSLTGSKELDVPLQIPKNVQILNGIKSVKVKIIINEYITKDFNVDVNATGLSSGLNATLDKKTIVVSITGMQNEVDKINQSDLSVTLDLSGRKEGDVTLEPKITCKNDRVKIIGFNPKNIKVVITGEAKDTSSNKDEVNSSNNDNKDNDKNNDKNNNQHNQNTDKNNNDKNQDLNKDKH